MNNSSPRVGKFIRLWQSLLASFVILFTVILIALFYWFYTFTTELAMKKVNADLTRSVKTLALHINGDQVLALSQEGKPNAAGIAWEAAAKGGDAEKQAALAQYGPTLANGFSDDQRYLEMLDWLDTVHKIDPLAWTYIWLNGDIVNNKVKEDIYVVDLLQRYNPAKAPYFNMHDQDDSDQVTDFEISTEGRDDFQPYQDKWGRWYSAWLPLRTSKGELVGGIGVDYLASEIDQIQETIRNIMIVAFLLTYLLTLPAILWLSRTITRPVAALTRAAELVGQGQYEQDFSHLFEGRRFYNEVGILAREFSIMVGKVYQREQNLVHQIQELKIEIDEAKRQKEVSDIVDTDFFHDLQSRASEMRQRRARPPRRDGDMET